MVTVPKLTPVTIPELLPTVAIPVPDEDQVPPATPSVNVIVPPIHAVDEPLIVPDVGNGVTVTVVVT